MVGPIYDLDNRCMGCGEHLADPHEPDCFFHEENIAVWEEWT